MIIDLAPDPGWQPECAGFFSFWLFEIQNTKKDTSEMKYLVAGVEDIIPGGLWGNN